MKRLILILGCLMPPAAIAQLGADPGLVYEMASENNIFFGVRAAGMGGAQIAAGDDGSAVWYNPALLTRIRRLEFSGALSHQRFFNQTDLGNYEVSDFQMNNTRLSGLWAVMPVPVEQGGLSLAFAAGRIKSFDRLFRYESEEGWYQSPFGDGLGGGEDDLGGLWVYSAGGGLELSRYTAIGLALEVYSGSDNYTLLEDQIEGALESSYRFELKDAYSGYSAKLGLAYSANSAVHLGATVRFPTPLTVEQTGLDSYTENGETSTDILRGEYKYVMPFSFGAGGLVAIRNLLIAGDINYADFTQIEYKRGVDLPIANGSVKNYYRDVLSYNLGAEYLVPRWGLTLRAGYARDPIPYLGYPITEDLDIFTAGFGYLLDKTLKLDVAVNFLGWTREDPQFLQMGTFEKYRAQRFFIGFTYRI